jgi:hypothetical protein
MRFEAVAGKLRGLYICSLYASVDQLRVTRALGNLVPSSSSAAFASAYTTRPDFLLCHYLCIKHFSLLRSAFGIAPRVCSRTTVRVSLG